MPTLIAASIAAATLAFGAVYPWGYTPLFVAAAFIGGIGIHQHRLAPNHRWLMISCLCLAGAVALQLVPVPRAALNAISPRAIDLLEQYEFAFAGSARHAASIAPASTAVALAGLASLALYLLGFSAMLSRTTLRALPAYLMIFAVPLALFGIVSRELNNGLVYWFWKPQTGGGSGAFGPFVNRNHFAGWMLMACCVSIGALLGEVERVVVRKSSGWRDWVSWLSSRAASRLILTTAASVVMSISLVWTMSRSGIVSFVVAIGCFMWMLSRRMKLPRLPRALVVIALVLLLAVALGWRGAGRIIEWFQDPRDLLGRLDAWRDGWRLIKDFPLTGTGINTYSVAMLFYQRSNAGWHLAQAHNDYLQLVAEGGVLVAVPAVTAMLSLAAAVRRNLESARRETRGYWIRAGAAVALIAIAVQEGVEFSLQIPANAFLFCTLAALALSPADAHAPSRLPSRKTESFL